MTLTLRAAMLLGAAALWPAFAANAADYDPPVVVDQASDYVPVEVGSGWYLRGDVTYNINKSVYDFDSAGIDDDQNIRFGGGGGIGYHFTDYLRADLNLAFVGRDRFGYSDPGVFTQFRNQQYTGMANAYVDLGTVAGFTPYVGAGAGLMYSRADLDLTYVNGFEQSAKDTQTKFAYTLNAGLAYQISRNTSIDVGYQYLNSPKTEFADINTGTIQEGIDYHQIKVGLRYDLW